MTGAPLNASRQEFDPSESSIACHDRCQASPAGAATDLSLPHVDRFGLARPRILVQLYTAIVLTLAVLCTLAGVTIRYACETVVAVRHLNDRELGPAVLFSRAEALLADNRRLVEAAVAPIRGQAAESAVHAYQTNSIDLTALVQNLGYAPSHPLSRRLEVVTSQGAVVFALAQAEGRQAIAASQYATSCDDLRGRIAVERQQRVDAAEARLNQLTTQSRILIAWILAGASIAGLLTGPLGLFLLRRVLKRIQAVGASLGRLARNDTSVDIPDLMKRDEIGEFARSVAVFKAKSIELLHKKAELERLNLQLDAAINNMPLGLSMFDAHDRLLVCNARCAEMYQLPGELTLPGTSTVRTKTTTPGMARAIIQAKRRWSAMLQVSDQLRQ